MMQAQAAKTNVKKAVREVKNLRSAGASKINERHCCCRCCRCCRCRH